YSFSIAGLDQSGNQEAPAAISVTADLNYPIVTVSTPMAGADGFYSDVRPIAAFTGNTADSPAGIVPPVKIEISKLLPDRSVEKKWDGSQWSVLSSTWLAVNSVNPWDINSPALDKNKRYKTELWAKDNAGNQTPTGGAGAIYREFVYDTNKPSTTINVPNLAYHNKAQITALSGTAVDWVNLSTEAYSGIAPSGVEIQIVDVTGGNLKYDGAGAFNAGDNWRPLAITYFGGSDPYFGVQLSSSVSWSYPAADTWPPALNEGGVYKVRARARDRSQNPEIYVERQFTYDNYSPTTTVTMPGVSAYPSMPEIRGDFTEAVSGINPGDGIQVALKRNSDSNYWDGNVWISTGFAVTNWRNVGGVYTSSWTYINAALNNYFNTLAGSLEFTAYVRGRDTVGNKNVPDTPAPSGGVVFKMDRFIPVSVSTWPAMGAGVTAYRNAPVSNISGTALDLDPGVPSGLNNVYTRVRRFNSGGVRCDFDVTFGNWNVALVEGWLARDAGSPAAWIKNMSQTNFKGPNGGDCYNGADKGDGFRFEVQSYAIDNAQNTEVAYSSAAFVLDYSTPTAGVAAPAHQSFFKSLASLTGTASDPVAGGGIPSSTGTIWVELADTDRNPDQYWNFTSYAWQAAYSSGAITAASNWLVPASSLPVNTPTGAANSWAVGRSSAAFVLKVKAFDKAGNYSDFSLNQSTFTLDLTEPDSVITSPAVEDGGIQTISAITGTAADYTADISTVQIRLWQDTAQGADCVDLTNNGKYWTGSSWQGTEIWLGVNSYAPATDVWSYAITDADLKPRCYYIVKSSAVDNASGSESVFGSRRFKFTPPDSFTKVLVPGDLRYQKVINTVSGTANAATKSLALELRRLSDNYYWNFPAQGWQAAVFSTGPIIPSGGNWSHALNLPQFLHNSSYTFRPTGTNFSDVPEDFPVLAQVFVDTVPPVGTVTSPDPAKPYYKAFSRAGGAVADPPGATPPAAGIYKVWAQLKAVNGAYTGKYWDNTSSTFTAVWNQAGNEGSYYIAGSSWDYTVSYPTAAFINGVQYETRFRASDPTYNSGVLEGTQSDLSAANVFNFDIIVPTAAVTA
ncbi:MAG: hypothetical protein Q8O90_04920, partial [Elusimicrobiota bacterium]|nr:hypothetical protein [Elusimicrobiota bacterium]